MKIIPPIRIEFLQTERVKSYKDRRPLSIVIDTWLKFSINCINTKTESSVNRLTMNLKPHKDLINGMSLTTIVATKLPFTI